VNLGVFGGTFNPVHIAHLRVAEEVREALGLAKVLWIPSADPPHKHTSIAPATCRLEMVRLATASNPAFETLDLELSRPGPSYTVDTLTQLGEMHPDARLWFLIGADALDEIHTWYRPERLFELASFAVFSRPGTPSRPLAKRLGPEVARLFRSGPTGLEHPDGHELREVTVPQIDVSASDLRRRIARGASVRYLVPDPVIDYIDKHRLYREDS
jgi:nicotinate-nucleotide adenylyltransferase